MLKNSSYKKKHLLLNAAALIVVILVYQFGIKRSLNAYMEYTDSEKKTEQLTDTPAKIASMEKELVKMDNGIGGYNTEGPQHEQELLELITGYCQVNNTVLREFPKTIIFEKGDILIETNRFVVQGSFQSLLNLIYTLEQKSKIGKVASVEYQIKKEIKDKKILLTASIFLQNIKKKTP